ncbi:heparinase II/III domain-containing protein [Miniimonas arenae]|uniref:heparinase II/III domain-containing protein n=2 Tax=Miniimonas arenae TaxID=676201 RepID=UPI0015D633A2|nr:heparinase II/III family protein [Miniimonas arenae]
MRVAGGLVAGTLTGPLASWADALEPGRLAALLDASATSGGPGGSSLLPVPPATDRTAWSGPDGPDRATAVALVAAARARRAEPWPAPRASDLARFWLDGDRVAYETPLFARTGRFAHAVVAAALEPDPTDRPAALAEVLDGVVLLCEQSTWSWPAHDDAHLRRGWVLPDRDAPYLDLGAGEVAAALAWTDALLGELLEEAYPGVRALVRREVRARVLDPFLAAFVSGPDGALDGRLVPDRPRWHWLGLDGPAHNWTAWICGNVLVAALALEDDGARRTRLVAEATAGLDRFLAVVPDDGAIDEGWSYWWEGAARALGALDVLRHASGGVLDAATLPVVRALVAFPHQLLLGPDFVASYADATPRVDVQPRPWHVLHRWGRLVDDDAAVALAAAHRGEGVVDLAVPGNGLGALLPALTDRAWRDAGGAGGAEQPHLAERVWLPSTQVLLARPATARGLTLVVKGGHNGEAHNHLDVGSVTVALDGVPAVVDPGRATYTAATFSDRRYTEWHVTSAWHPVPAPRGREQGVGAAYGARDVEVHDGGAGLSLDLAGAYPGSGVGAWRRSARLLGAGERVEVVDAWELAGDEPTRVAWVLAGEVELSASGAVVRPVAGERTLEVTWSADVEVTASLTPRALTDGYLRAAWGESVTRLDLVATAATGRLLTTFTAR